MSFLPKNAIKTAPTAKAMFIIHKKFHVIDTGIKQTLYRHYTDISFSFMMIIQDLRNKYLRPKNSKSLLRLKYLHFEKHSSQVT